MGRARGLLLIFTRAIRNKFLDISAAARARACGHNNNNKNMAAASERGEKVNPKVNFRTFAARKKTEYALRFPFLTERQILAKLRRVWQCRKEALADGRRGDSGKFCLGLHFSL